MEIRNRKLLYHQTKLDNLESIVTNGLLSRAALREKNMAFQDVADAQILAGRHEYNLDEYVPFHFTYNTKFDYKVRANEPNAKFIYLCMQREKAKELEAKILPAHPLCHLDVQLYSYDEGIEAIEWDVMEKDRKDVIESEYKRWKQIRMAECLIKNRVDINDMLIIFTKSVEDADTVKKILDEHKIKCKNENEQPEQPEQPNYEHTIYIKVNPGLFLNPRNQPE